MVGRRQASRMPCFLRGAHSILPCATFSIFLLEWGQNFLHPQGKNMSTPLTR